MSEKVGIFKFPSVNAGDSSESVPSARFILVWLLEAALTPSQSYSGHPVVACGPGSFRFTISRGCLKRQATQSSRVTSAPLLEESREQGSSTSTNPLVGRKRPHWVSQLGRSWKREQPHSTIFREVDGVEKRMEECTLWMCSRMGTAVNTSTIQPQTANIALKKPLGICTWLQRESELPLLYYVHRMPGKSTQDHLQRRMGKQHSW